MRRNSIKSLVAIGIMAVGSWITLDSILNHTQQQQVKPKSSIQHAPAEIANKYVIAPSWSSNFFGYDVPRIVPNPGESNLSIKFFDADAKMQVYLTISDPILFNKYSIGDKVTLEYTISQKAMKAANGQITNYVVTGHKFQNIK